MSPIVSVALREAVEELGATVRLIIPLPVPPAALSVIQETGLEADHPHPRPAVTNTLVITAPPPTEREVGETVTSHAPDCVTVKARPAIETVPVRLLAVGFAAIDRFTVPDEGSVELVLAVIQGTLDVAVQLQSTAHTFTAYVEAAGPTKIPLLESAAVQLVAACVTVKLRPPIVSTPMRLDVVVFAATV